MRGISEDKFVTGAFIRDGKELNRCFNTCQFQHVRISINGVANLLAMEGLRQGIQFCMQDGVLGFAMDAVANDSVGRWSILWFWEEGTDWEESERRIRKRDEGTEGDLERHIRFGFTLIVVFRRI